MYTLYGNRERGNTHDGMAMGRREATDGEKGRTVSRAGSSGRSLSRRRVRGNGQVYKVIGGIIIYQGDKPIWRLSRLRFLIKSKFRLFCFAPSQLVGQQPEYSRPSISPNYSPASQTCRKSITARSPFLRPCEQKM